MNVDRTHGCLLLAVGTPVVLIGVLGLSIELSGRTDPGGVLFAVGFLLMGAAGIITAIWLFLRARSARTTGASVDPATAQATIKAWIIVGVAFSVVYTVLAVWGFTGELFRNPALSWSVSITAILLWIGCLLAAKRQYSVARVFFLIGGILGLPLAVPMIIGGKRIELAGQALARVDRVAESQKQLPDVQAHQSAFANQLLCKHCGAQNLTNQWPTEGDNIAFAYQAEPGNFNLKVHCPHCDRDWYVVWDENPGAIETLAITNAVQSTT